MPYLLDANAVIALMKGHPALQSRVRQAGVEALCICTPVEARAVVRRGT